MTVTAARTETTFGEGMFGLSGQGLRGGLERELVQAMRVEDNAPTVHAIAHSIARVLEEDHLRMAEQLERTGCHLGSSDDQESEAGARARLATD